MPDEEHSTLEVIMTDRKEYIEELRDNNESRRLPESPLYLKIHEENQRAQQRQDDFRLAAQYIHIAGI